MSKYYNLSELYYSETAKRKGIDNSPETKDISKKLTTLMDDCLDKICDAWGGKLRINSGYRSRKLNEAVGGSKTSQHSKGEAGDISTTNGKNKELMAMILGMGDARELNYDQLINEYPAPDGTPKWIHISYKESGNRKSKITITNAGTTQGINLGRQENSFDSQTSSNTPTETKVTSSVYGTLSMNNPLNFTKDEIKQKEDIDYRLYQLFGTEIVLDELSLALDQLSYGYTGGNTLESNDNLPANRNRLFEMGKRYPFIRINDYYCLESEIKSFSISSIGFLPVCTLTLVTKHKKLIQGDIVKEGDKLSVYISGDNNSYEDSNGNSMDSPIRPLRCDFKITSIFSTSVKTAEPQESYKFILTGELNVPSLFNTGIKFAHFGTSRDALIEAAKLTKLGFAFNNPNNTNDSSGWTCQPTGNQGMREFIQDTASRAYLDKNHFFDAWIDLRYNLTFCDVNQQLRWEGLDPSMDMAVVTPAITQAAMEGNTVRGDSTSVWGKLFTNMLEDAKFTMTSFFVTSYDIENNASEITDEIGRVRESQMIASVSSKGFDENSFDISTVLAINWDKIQSGKFYVLNGPNSGTTFQSADDANGQYTQTQKTQATPTYVPTMADSDGQSSSAAGNNMLSSGNVSKFYQLGKEHNFYNNKQLEKQYLNITCQGLNLGVIKGDKVPVILKSRHLNVHIDSSPKNVMDLTCTGWFYVAGVEYVYSQDNSNLTKWETHLKLTRREWTIPTDTPEGDEVAAVTVDSTGNVVNGVNNEPEDNGPSSGTPVSESSPTTGLSGNALDIWNSVVTAAKNNNYRVNLISGRRWAADEDGEKVDGNAFLRSGDKYKVVNTDGSIAWYTNNNSPHLYGCALDITGEDNDKDFSRLLEIIINSGEVLYKLYRYGYSVKLETDGAKVHLDISTDNSGQDAWWSVVRQIKGCNQFYYNKQMISFNDYAAYNNVSKYYEIKNQITTI